MHTTLMLNHLASACARCADQGGDLAEVAARLLSCCHDVLDVLGRGAAKGEHGSVGSHKDTTDRLEQALVMAHLAVMYSQHTREQEYGWLNVSCVNVQVHERERALDRPEP
eukprot:1158131-Pelagomonas_calceolata.AAC.1